MKNSLFRRLFWAFLGLMSATILILALTMVTLVRAERQLALEGELRVQARDVAQLLQSRDQSFLWRYDGIASTINWKLNEIRENYGASVWVVNLSSDVLVFSGDNVAAGQLDDPQVLNEIVRVLKGEEIRVQGLFQSLGSNVVTIGVPFSALDGRVLGAVLLHTSVDNLQVDYSDILRFALIAGAVAFSVGSVLAYLIANRNARPLLEINDAVADFAAGALDRRVAVRGEDEIARLAGSFNEMAERLGRLDESRRSFVANVSHELRSPMTSIHGYVQGMLDGTIEGGEQAKYLAVVLSETKRLTQLVNDLLDLSRIDSGSFPLTIAEFDINELILGTMFKYEKRIEEKNIEVDISFRDQPQKVLADRERIEQVLSNLIDNAVKYAPAGGQMTVWTHSVDKTCYVTIRNTGPAIPAEELPFIFERFYKVDKAHTSGGGIGLGLSIVKKILEQHGQDITVNSAGGMTSFAFTLTKAL